MKNLLTEWRKYLKEEEESDFKVHTMYNPETGESDEAQSEDEHNSLAEKGYVHVDPEAIRQTLKAEGGAAGLEAIMGAVDAEEEELQKAMMAMPDVAQHENGDYVMSDEAEVEVKKEAAEVKDKYDDEVERRSKKTMKQGLAFVKSEEKLQSFVSSIIDEVLSEDCWDGYERVPGTTEGEQGSCRKRTNEGAEGGFKVGEFVNVVDGSLKGATGKVVELTTTTTGEEGYVIELYSDAKMKVFGKRGDEVIALAGDLESGGTTDGMELYDIDEGEGLWKNIHAKKKRMKAGSGEKKAEPGDEDYPETLDIDEAELTERGSPLESGLQTAVQDFIIEQMQKMGLNAGDPTDRDRIKNQVMSIVSTAISAIGLDESKKVDDSLQENVAAFIDDFFIKEETDKERMKCNSPRYIKKGEPGYGKKQKVVKACKDGKEKIIRFGDANMENKSDSKDNKSNFRSRHNCDEKTDKFSAGYWSCKDW